MKIIAVLLASAFCTTGFLKGSYKKTVAGQQVQVCIYQVGADKVEVMQSAFQLCSHTKEFCF